MPDLNTVERVADLLREWGVGMADTERLIAALEADGWVRLTRDKEDDTVRTLERWGWFGRADWPSDRHTAKRCVALIFDSLSPHRTEQR